MGVISLGAGLSLRSGPDLGSLRWFVVALYMAIGGLAIAYDIAIGGAALANNYALGGFASARVAIGGEEGG